MLPLPREFPRTTYTPHHPKTFMAKIFLGIALAVMLATAALGFLAMGNANKLQTTLKDSKQALTTAQSTLSIAKSDLKKSQEELTAAVAKADEATKEVATQKGQMDDLTKKITDATTAMEAKTAEVATLTKQIEDLMKKGGVPVAGGEDPVVAALKAELAKAQAEVAESKALIDSVTTQKKELGDKMASLEQYKKTREAGLQRQGITGRVLAVNGGWNFLVLSVGDKQGAVMNGTMIVLRGGEPIAKARITSVEASQSIADILPGSVRKGVTVQPGDTVVFEGTRAAAAQPAPGAQAGLPVR